MGYVDLRGEALVVLLYVFVSNFCITTSYCIFVVVVGVIMFDCLGFLSLTQLQKKCLLRTIELQNVYNTFSLQTFTLLENTHQILFIFFAHNFKITKLFLVVPLCFTYHLFLVGLSSK